VIPVWAPVLVVAMIGIGLHGIILIWRKRRGGPQQ
jgi:hypothetical protein